MVYAVADADRAEVEALGAADLAGTTPMSRDTIFRIASLTKPVVAVGAMMLVDDGAIVLDEPVDGLLPELAGRRVLRRLDGPLDDTVPASRPITVDDLLTMRMGHGLIVEPSFQPPYPVITAAEDMRLVMGPPDPRTPHDPDEWIKLFGTLPLMDQPGERWRYNTGSLVLGVLVARAAGRPRPRSAASQQQLGDVLRERLFAPLGMRHTGFVLPAEDALRLPTYYMTNPETGVLEAREDVDPAEWSQPPPFPSAAAGLASTVDDYLAFARLLLNGGVHDGSRLLSADSVARMPTNQLTPEQLATAGPLLGGRGWGLGMSVTVAPDDASPVPGRYGWEGGYGTVWHTDPVRGRVAIALTQTTDFMFNGGTTEFVTLAMRA